jgi:hypothetical protein
MLDDFSKSNRAPRRVHSSEHQSFAAELKAPPHSRRVVANAARPPGSRDHPCAIRLHSPAVEDADMFKWLHPNVNGRGHATQPDGLVARRFVQPHGGTRDRRQGGRRVNAGRREADVIAQRTEAPRVLIIAPNLDTRLLYTMLFEQAGCTVYAADEDPAGTAMAQHHLPDVVVAEGVQRLPPSTLSVSSGLPRSPPTFRWLSSRRLSTSICRSILAPLALFWYLRTPLTRTS